VYDNTFIAIRHAMWISIQCSSSLQLHLE